MGRIVVFVITILALGYVISVKKYNDLEVKEERFDFDKQEKAYVASQKKLAEAKKLLKESKKLPEPKDDVIIDDTPLVALTSPELENGSKKYSACISCHGKTGEGKKGNNAPKIGGQERWYLEHSLISMKNKVRWNKDMDPYLRKLDEQDLKDLALYISKLPW